MSDPKRGGGPPPIPKDAKINRDQAETPPTNDDKTIALDISDLTELPPANDDKTVALDIGDLTEITEEEAAEIEHSRNPIAFETTAVAEPDSEPEIDIEVGASQIVDEAKPSESPEEVPIIDIGSESEPTESGPVASVLSEISTRFGALTAAELNNPDFKSALNRLMRVALVNPEAAKNIRQIIDKEAKAAEPTDYVPALQTTAGKKSFQILGAKWFERNPTAFREKFGFSSQVFTPRELRIEIATKWALESEGPATNKVEELLANKIILPDEALGILHKLDGVEAGKLEQIILAAEVGPLAEARERLEMIYKYDELREKLSEAVKTEMPELSEMEAERRENERKLSEKEVSHKPIGSGLTAPFFVEGPSGVNGVYKPRLHESGNKNGDGTGGLHYRLSLRVGEAIGSEVLASTIGLLAGIKRTPETIVTNGPVGIGSKQRLVKGEMATRIDAMDVWMNRDGTINDDYLHDMEDVAILHILTNNSDGHMSNVMVDTENQAVYPIDFGLSQVDGNSNPEDALADACADAGIEESSLTAENRALALRNTEYRIMMNDALVSGPQYLLRGKSINPEIMQRLERLNAILNQNGQVADVLQKQFELFYGDEKGRRLKKLFKERLTDLLQEGKYPATSVMFNVKYKKSMDGKIKKRKERP